MPSPLFLRRRAAGQYLKDRFGFGSEKTLAKLASVGDGPLFHRAGHVPTRWQPSTLRKEAENPFEIWLTDMTAWMLRMGMENVK